MTLLDAPAAALAPSVAAIEGWNEWHLALQGPWGRTGSLIAVAAAIAIVALSSWGALRDRRPRRRILLAALRAGVALAALMLFFQPALQLENVTRLPNRIAILVDNSESMSLAEEAGMPTRAERTARRIAQAAPELAEWRKEHRLDFYTFGASLQPSSEAAVTAGASTATADATRLREALAALRTRYQGRDLGGVVVFSDGIDNGRLGESAAPAESARAREARPEAKPSEPRVAGELDGEARDFLRSLEAPVHTVWTGRPGLRDVAIAHVLADDFAFARNAVKVEAIVRVVGAKEAGWVGRSLPVTLRRDGVPVKTASIVVDGSEPDQKVTFEFTPDRVGKYLYEISTPLVDGEAIAQNNARTFLLKVIRDKIRVLQVAGRPSWDERFLRGLLKHDPNIDLISFFILRTPTDVEAVSPEEMSLIPFPTEELFMEQLRSFDVVFLQNFNYGPYGIGVYLDEIKRYVEEGGGLAMIGGDLSFSSGGYARTPVSEVLPVELLDPPFGSAGYGFAPASTPDQLTSLDPFRIQITPAGGGHPITALRLEARENAQRWDGLAPLDGCNLVARARPGATVLGTHPFLKGQDGRPLPVLAVADVGKGRSLAFTSDSSWRWGFGARNDDGHEAEPRGASGSAPTVAAGAHGGDARGRAYQRFWENAIRWLIRDPELRFLRVETDQAEYARGEKVRVAVRALTPDYLPARNLEVSLSVSRVLGGSHGDAPRAADSVGVVLATRNVRTDENGEADWDLDPPPPSGYRITARAQLPGAPTGKAGTAREQAMQDDEVFLVRGAGRELEDAEAKDGLLRAVADASGGQFRGESDALSGLNFLEAEVVRVDRHRDVELWSSWLTLAVAALLMALEWSLRRRWGLA